MNNFRKPGYDMPTKADADELARLRREVLSIREKLRQVRVLAREERLAYHRNYMRLKMRRKRAKRDDKPAIDEEMSALQAQRAHRRRRLALADRGLRLRAVPILKQIRFLESMFQKSPFKAVK